MAIDKATLIDYARRFRDALTPKNGFRAAAYGLAMLGLGAAASFPAAAEQATLTSQQCREAKAVTIAVMSKYAISPRLATSFKQFTTSGCDLKTNFEVDTTVDDRAFGEFRTKLIVLRKAEAGGSPQLAVR